MIYTNQKEIKTEKALSNKDNLYGIFNQDALQQASIELNGAAFKLYCYLNKNQDGYTFGLSKVDAVKWGINSYDRAVKELIDKGYLVNTCGDKYTFYEKPKAKVIQITIEKSKE